jgi:hypothetical protein
MDYNLGKLRAQQLTEIAFVSLEVGAKPKNTSSNIAGSIEMARM